MIRVQRRGGSDLLDFAVTVEDATGQSRHRVTMTRETCLRLTQGRHPPERCIEAAFRFLLDREPKEAILARFDVTLIGHYFPEFERELPGYLDGT